jgi:hypothetical protein
MRKASLTTIAAAALIAGAGLATAQQTEREPGRVPKAVQSPSLDQPGTMEYPSERQPGAMKKAPSQGRSAEDYPSEGQPGAMKKAPSQGRSAAEGENSSGQPGAMRPDMGKPMEHRSVTTLSLEQRTKLHQAIATGNFQRADHVNFSLAVGTRVPDSVRIYDVPRSIAEIIPEYRGFKYIVVQGELIIVDPGTLEVVAVLPA